MRNIPRIGVLRTARRHTSGRIPMERHERLMSLDALRGADMLFFVFLKV